MGWQRLVEMAGIRHRSDKLLKEQEDDLFGDDDEEEGGDDEGGDEEAGDDMFAGSDDDAEEEEEEEEEKDPVETLTPEELAKFGPGEIDQELDSIMADVFAQSMKSAEAKSAQSAGYPGATEDEIIEAVAVRSMQVLLEDSAEDIAAVAAEEFDMGKFCSEIARYIQHYETLIDMEGMIFNKAKQFILNNFNQETADLYQEKMALDHGIDLDASHAEDMAQPLAVGAGAAEG